MKLQLSDIKYTAFFVKKQDILSALKKIGGGDGLGNFIDAPHITTSYHPTEVNTSLFGKQVDIIIDGYGKNETNEGFSVTIKSNDEEVQKEIDKITKNDSIPHITTSISDGAKAVNTRYLDFEPVKKMRIKGTFGCYTMDGKVITDSSTVVESLKRKLRESLIDRYLDRTIFSVEMFGRDKYVHFLGYGFYEGRYVFVEYDNCYVPLEDVVIKGLRRCEDEYSALCKQYETECTEQELINTYEHYNRGRRPQEIPQITDDIDCGMYIW